MGRHRHHVHGSPVLEAIAADAMLSENGWTCPDCGEVASGRGPSERSPAEDVPGHAEVCQRLAAAVADWLAQGD